MVVLGPVNVFSYWLPSQAFTLVVFTVHAMIITVRAKLHSSALGRGGAGIEGLQKERKMPVFLFGLGP